jgi:hypothetical protein
MNPQMYINPAVIMMFFALITVCCLLGGVLWRLAGIIGDVKRDVAVVIERLDGHIKACGHQKQRS